MKKYLKVRSTICGLIVIILFSCDSSRKIPKSENISISNKENGLYTKQHFRKGWLFVDEINKRKLISRKVYLNDTLMYRYPIIQSKLSKSIIQLLSGNDYLLSGIPDTLYFQNKDLPIMNKFLTTTGGTIVRLSDSLYVIKSFGTSKRVVINVGVSANMDEIKNSAQFKADSLVLPIR